MKNKYDYPFCECDHHPGRQRSYCVCNHVFDGVPVAEVEMASDSDAGVILCRDCIGKKAKVEYFKLVCEGCAIDRGFLIAV